MTNEPAEGMKFCIVIVPSGDGERLLNRMSEQGFPATRIGSTGGFLKRGSATKQGLPGPSRSIETCQRT